MKRHAITDKRWARVEPLIANQGGSGDNRLFIDAVRWVDRTGPPWRDLPEKAKTAILNGPGEPFEVIYRRAGKETMRFMTEFEGVLPNLERRFADTESEFMREKLEEMMELRPCPTCAPRRPLWRWWPRRPAAPLAGRA